MNFRLQSRADLLNSIHDPSARRRTAGPPSAEVQPLIEADDLRHENVAHRDRLARLSEASRRITEDLDLDTVLQEVVDGARSLTGARRGCLIVVDESGQLDAFVTSGVTVEEHQLFVALPGGIEFFYYLIGMSEPIRVADFSAHIASVGLPEVGPPLGPVKGFLGTPIRHRGQHVGIVNVSDKAGGLAFTQEDEDTLLMFASQAAMAIANARRYQDEQRARADLETLINTSPVGVIVFDARTGAPVSLNREGRKIVDSLRNPDQSAEQLLDVLTFRRADGREISLREFPLAQALSTGETVRAEEIVIQVPDGRRITTLVNATPIRSEAGVVESVVVTLQDLTALHEVERLRAEFLGVVSHELLTPLSTIKGAAASVLGAALPLTPAETRQFFRIVDAQADRMRRLIQDLLDVTQIETGSLPLTPEPAAVAALVATARTAFLRGGATNTVDLDLPPDLPRIQADRPRIIQVLGILFATAARFAPDASTIRVTARADDVHVAVVVTNPGGGIAAERLPGLFRRFAQSDGGDGDPALRDEGLGLAVCQGIVVAHGGRIWAESDGSGFGTRFTFTVPVVDEAADAWATDSSRRPAAADDRARVLAIDDDPQVLWHVRHTLSEAGFVPIVTGDPEEMHVLIDVDKPHLILLDLALPGIDGFALMQRIAQFTDTPVVFLSGRGGDQDIARAFELGADDYIVKPFSPTELVARVKASLRRSAAARAAEPPASYELGNLTINYAERRVTLADRPLRLTATEYKLLTELALNAGIVLTHKQLRRRVWAVRDPGDSGVLRTYIRRLRRTLGDDATNPTYIFNEPRVGYRMPKGDDPVDASPQTV